MFSHDQSGACGPRCEHHRAEVPSWHWVSLGTSASAAWLRWYLPGSCTGYQVSVSLLCSWKPVPKPHPPSGGNSPPPPGVGVSTWIIGISSGWKSCLFSPMYYPVNYLSHYGPIHVYSFTLGYRPILLLFILPKWYSFLLQPSELF